MDYLLMGSFLLDKKDQAEWEETEDWQSEFPLD